MKEFRRFAYNKRGNLVSSATLVLLAASANPTEAFTPGKDGSLTVTGTDVVLNSYSALNANLAAGSTALTVADVSTLGGVEAGDLLMIYQAQGATINTSNDFTYGDVTSLGSSGLYEFVSVVTVDTVNDVINFEGCSLNFGTLNSYTTAGNTQIIRVPQYSNLTIQGGGSVAPPAWNGTSGGVVVVHIANTATINGTVNATGRGFRGALSQNTLEPNNITDYITTDPDEGALKGESIAGNLTTVYGRGAPANGGGGGCSHNAAGGGGANGDNGNSWTIGNPAVTGGQGVMPASGPEGFPLGPTYNWLGAWALDPGYIANGNALTNSAGGGRGGYTFSGNNENELTLAPGDGSWGGDSRREAGGLGGRPMTNSTDSRLFLGGGGGAGHMNNRVNVTDGSGGNGGGLVFIIANTVTGTGTIESNGLVGQNTQPNNPNDAPGGGGAGGTVVVKANSLSGISIEADGGRGGIQPYTRTSNEAEGGGGGGGGGYIAVDGGTVTRSAAGGLYGFSTSQSVDDFQPNGGTTGADGQPNESATTIQFCSSWITGVVFDDLNGDGIRQPGEPGIPNITVTVERINNGIKVLSDLILETDADGVYYAAIIEGTDLTATVDGTDPDLGANPVLTTANDVQTGMADASVGFNAAPVGYTGRGAISGNVFSDGNQDGTLDPGESGYSSVTVTIQGAGPDGIFGNGDDPSPVVSDTNGNGDYSATGLPSGLYRITVDEADLPAGAGTLTAGANPRTVTVSAGSQGTENFGYSAGALSITKSSNAGAALLPGNTVDYTVVLTNTSGATINGVTLTDPLPTGTTYVSNSLNVNAPTGSGSSTETYRDEFSTASSYAGTNGSINWAPTPWIETNDDGSAGGGNTVVTGGVLDITGNDIVTRTADLSDAGITAVTFTFALNNTGFETNGFGTDTMTVQARPNNSAAWITLVTYTSNGAGGTTALPVGNTATPSFDLLAAFSPASPTATAQVRFVSGFTSSTFDDAQIDNVQIQLATAGRANVDVAGGSPPDLTAQFISTNGAIDLLAGETITATYRVTVNASPGVNTIDNTATGSGTGVASVSGGVSDPLGGTITGHVFDDTDGDGVQDPGEPDLANIDVNIVNADGTVVTVSTDGNGDYSAVVRTGTNTVTVDESDPQVPFGSVVTTSNNPQVVTVSAGNTTATTDVGLTQSANIVGRVFQDLNGDGIQTPGEPFVPFIDVVLTLSNGQTVTVQSFPDGSFRLPVPLGVTIANVNENDPILPPGGATVTTFNDPQNTTAAAGAVTAFTPFGLFFSGPLLVELDYLKAGLDDYGIVTVEWATNLEDSNAGFHILRSVGIEPTERITSTIIPGLGDSLVGGEYSWSDPEPMKSNEVRYYFLMDIDLNGTETLHGPVSVEASEILNSAVGDWMSY